MKGQRFYTDNHKEKYLYTEQCHNYYNGKGFIDGKDKNQFMRLWKWPPLPIPEYKVENTEWNEGSGFDYTAYDLFGSKTGGIWEAYIPSDAIFHVKMTFKERIKRWMNI